MQIFNSNKKRIKKLIFALTVIGFLFACNQQPASEGFTINGSISGFDSGMVYLTKRADGKWVNLDSVTTQEGNFIFKGSVDFPEVNYLAFGDYNNLKTIFLENSEITFDAHIDSLKDASIIGSSAQDEYMAYTLEGKSYDDKMNEIYEKYKTTKEEGNEDLAKEIYSTLNVVYEEKLAFISKYIGEHNQSVISPYILDRELKYSLNVNELDSMLSILDSTISKSPYVKALTDRVAVMRTVEIGKEAPDFTINDTTGTPIALSSFRGKYLLIDFWAAWCGSCRRENPNNVTLYADYKDKGFEILGVSFDRTREDWVKAIIKDGLTWPQVSELKYWNSETGKIYAVSSIPHTVLLDKEGVIIAKNLRGDELRAKIAKLLD
ncbi:MAG: TlpA disulfide reductase family protein [Bacteroidota bacterium]